MTVKTSLRNGLFEGSPQYLFNGTLCCHCNQGYLSPKGYAKNSRGYSKRSRGMQFIV